MAKQPKSESTVQGRRGAAINLYLHPADTSLINKLRLHLMKQEKFASQSQVIRAALHLAKANDDFVRSFDAIATTDGRKRDR